MKNHVQYIIRKLHLTRLADAILYRLALVRNKRSNRIFRQEHPGIPVPPDYYLYETYRLDYRKYIEDGHLAAKEIAAWSAPYLQGIATEILDWGCGTGRVTRHLASYFPGCVIHGCDINAGMIEWNRRHYTGIQFSVIRHTPPTHYQNAQFGLIAGLSVCTHTDAAYQQIWLDELYRILKPGGLLIITTHGAAYEQQLVPAEKQLLRSNGIYTRTYPEPGHRMVSTYHDAVQFRQMLENKFIVLEHHDGSIEPYKIGGQDLWILRRK